jgi:hypothetical protein
MYMHSLNVLAAVKVTDKRRPKGEVGNCNDI